jgi:hypothetical protein
VVVVRPRAASADNARACEAGIKRSGVSEYEV